jgi:hypothetical protein
MKVALYFKANCEVKIPKGRTLKFQKDELIELDSCDFPSEEALKETIKELFRSKAAVPGGPHIGPVVRMFDGK